MALTSEQVDVVWAKLMRRWSDRRDQTHVSKHELRAAIVGLDLEIDNNASTINSWIPLPARTEMSAEHKIELMAVLLKERVT